MGAMMRPHLPIMELKPTRRLAVLLWSAHLAVVFLLFMLPVALWIQWCGSAVLLLSAMLTVARFALRRGPHAVTALEFVDREMLRARTGNGVWHTGRVLGTSTVGAALAVLNLRFDDRGGAIHVVIPGDSLSADDFRRLRVWLRWGPQHVIDDTAAF